MIVAVVVLAGAIKGQFSMLFMIFGAMIGAMAASGILPHRMLRAVSLEREAPSQAWQNQTVHLGYYLVNKRRASCLALQVEELPAAGIASARGFCAHLRGGGVFRSGARFVARRRGRMKLAGARMTSSFPFGLVRASRVVDLRHSLAIWPARGRLKRRMLHQGAVEVSAGPPTQVTGGQDEFFGLREYRPDDNPRWIHWRRSATRRVPVVREMCRPTPEVLWIILDTHLADSSAPAWSAREQAIRFAGTLVEHALFRGYRVGLALAYADEVAVLSPGPGRGQLHRLLDALADIDLNTERTLGDTLAAVRRVQLDKAQAIVITADPAEANAAALSRIRRLCRNLTVITGAQLPTVFEDNALAAAEEA